MDDMAPPCLTVDVLHGSMNLVPQPLSHPPPLPHPSLSEDHARKTVTAEPHPHLAAGLTVASIHPCRHGEVMRRLVDKIQEGGGAFEVEHYMLLFLKFISSIVPTIQYDWTMTV